MAKAATYKTGMDAGPAFIIFCSREASAEAPPAPSVSDLSGSDASHRDGGIDHASLRALRHRNHCEKAARDRPALAPSYSYFTIAVTTFLHAGHSNLRLS
jgi:hypothetical protein